MQQFRREDVRAEQGLGGDALHERWLARDANGQEVVLVRLRDEYASRDDVRAAWLDLARRSAACKSAGLLQVRDSGMHGGAAWLVREHAADAITLGALLEHLEARGESMPVLLAVHVLRALSAILAEAHVTVVDGYVHPLFHGDLTPARVIVRADGRLQLTELGLHALARAPGDHVAPELTRGGENDARADVYALGALLKRMVVPGPARKSAPTRAGVPALPPHEVVLLITRLTASSPADRPASMAALQRELAMLATHGAGEAVLAQLHEDARTRQPPSALPVAPQTRVTGQKTAMFVTPLAADSAARAAAPAREAMGSFRGRTQVFGAPPTQAMTPLVAQAEPPPQSPSTTMHAPALLAPQSAAPPMSFLDEPPPLLGIHADAASEVRRPTQRLDMTGMPPLLSPAASASVPAAEPPPMRAIGAHGHEVGGAAREIAPSMRATTVARLASRRDDVAPPAPVHVARTQDESDEVFSAAHQESGLRLAPAVRADSIEAAPLALPEPGPRVESAAPVSRKREPWREASETVFKLKVPAVMAHIAPRERISPVLMFLIAMVVAAVLIVGIRLLVGLIA
ncbi:MAG: hypothetical protein ABW252_09270 [Polyangiales bacterium]